MTASETGRLIGYARVSTRDQNPNMQIDALKNQGCDPIFVESASGRNLERPKLEAALQALNPGDTLVVWRLSRLARSVRHIIAVSDFLQAHQIGLKILDQAIDTTTPAGRLFFHIIAAFDEFQREIIAENTIAGLKAAQQRGKTLGRPRKLDEAQTREAFEMLLLEEMSFEEVAAHFDVSHMTLRRAFVEYGLEWPETNKPE
ncbi:DNA invertase Pin-like site-specific DNA recombinase [Peteryoungia aggregata LMG 23059]|uniref:DNA invertase Pin-like site-specific DNA recombinase n=1 Tax=Peteryoungia aggregata LMG 23059 TaxID=1368425 RepID=A0ABU0G9C7_9HYPH|nr:recombinase family protein [Peteryoungia aggregata]MDQ0421954.1 DNA invertase Pin-like site-specific DNA recombinase [Peteryoungia aggregata LMG 23059]